MNLYWKHNSIPELRGLSNAEARKLYMRASTAAQKSMRMFPAHVAIAMSVLIGCTFGKIALIIGAGFGGAFYGVLLTRVTRQILGENRAIEQAARQ